MMMRISTIAVFITVFYSHGYAQISTNELPASFSLSQQDFQTNIASDKKTLYPQDMGSIRFEDEEDEQNGIPPRFGYRIKVDFDMTNSGTWINLPTGDKIWQLNIESPGALSLNLLYDKFWLPEGAKFFVFTSDKKHSMGAFNSRNNKGEKENPREFATGLLYGDNITLEYFQPKEIKEQGIISLAYVVHGYRYIKLPNMSTESIGDSGGCQVNVNCSEGANWQAEKNAVALILVNGNRYCTGSLVNTTGNNDIPYFLTADHCLGGWANSVKHDAISAPNLNHWSFYWQYESPTCANPGSEPPILSTVGATVVANNSNTDFALLLLTEDPKDVCGVTPYYLGWDRSGGAGTGGVGIHHPAGDIKKIATLNGTTNNNWNGNTNFWSHYWNQTTNGYSVTEGGSSGSPLINSSKRVIGQLYGGSSVNCSNPSQDIAAYGKFSVSWTGGGAIDNRRKLDHWLHTAGGAAPTIANGRLSTFITGPSLVCTSGATFTLNNVPAGATVTWQATPSNLFVVSSGSGINSTLSAVNSNTSGQGTITFTINVGCGNPIQVERTPWVGRPATPVLSINDVAMDVPPRRFTLFMDPPANQLITSYKWYLNNTLISPVNYLSPVFNRPIPYCGGTYLVGAEALNACGVFSSRGSLTVYEPSCYDMFSLSVFPNPSTDELLMVDLSFIPVTENITSDSETISNDHLKASLVLTDQNGEVLHTQTLTIGKSATLNVQKLNPGFYFVKVNFMDSSFEKRVLIRH